MFIKKNNTSYPEYFLPIIEELEGSRDVYSQTIAPAISTWWNTGISGGGKYADTEFICYINGESYSFDYNNLLPDTDESNWEVIGSFPDETANKTFVIFHHFVIATEINNIYIAAINLNTLEISYCEDEYHFTNDLVQQHYAQTSYQMCQFRATLQQNDIVVYSAFISEAYDTTPVGLISVAYEDTQPLAYMFIDLTTENLRNKLEIIHIN